MNKIKSLITAALLTTAALLPLQAQAFWTLFGSKEEKQAAPVLQICAVPQLYGPLTELDKLQQAHPSSVFKGQFALHFDTAGGLYSKIANKTERCDVLLADSERMPILLIRSQQAEPSSMHAFAKAPLVLYSNDPALFQRGAVPVKKSELKSLALPKASLTPVGFAAAEVVSSKSFPTNYLKHHLYRAEQEYQVFAMVSSGNVQAGFVTLPLIINESGSYWQIPADYYPEICYYAAALKGDLALQGLSFIEMLKSDVRAQECLRKGGFLPLNEEEQSGPYDKLPGR